MVSSHSLYKTIIFLYLMRWIISKISEYNMYWVIFTSVYLTFVEFCCIITSVIELQDPARTATKGVPAGTPLLIYGGYYGSVIPYLRATNWKARKW